jgi:hypothetical protein
MPTILQKLLQEQLGGHARLHLDTPDLPPIRVLHSVKKQGKKSARPSHVFDIVAKLEVHSGTCGMVARMGIGDLKPAGTILLVRSSSGLPFHVELGGFGNHRAVTRVSSGGTAKDLEKAIRRARAMPEDRGKRSDLRVLRVPAMHLSAVWVHHPKRPGADTFIPYTTNFAGLGIGRTHSLKRTERLLKQHATQMILRWYEGYEKTIKQPKA